ncbi:ANKRD50, partial [Symbiodinium microadriaticum]
MECKGQRYWAAVLAVKGDYEYHVDVAQYTRSYKNAGTCEDHEFCPELAAGRHKVPALDLSDEPADIQTLHESDPRTVLPALNSVPFSTRFPGKLYRRDAFHTLKFGLFKDQAAGIIVRLASLKIFDQPGDSSGKSPGQGIQHFHYVEAGEPQNVQFAKVFEGKVYWKELPLDLQLVILPYVAAHPKHCVDLRRHIESDKLQKIESLLS